MNRRPRRRPLVAPEQVIANAWTVAVAVAVCPACQVAPGTPCHLDGRPLDTPHPQRTTEAKETAA